MATDFSELDEPTLKKMLEDATDYESRSKIRAAIRELKKKTGQPLGRNRANTSQYRRPGFQAPRTVTIPNSVTGNVYPSVVKDGETTKKPDKNTPTIGYLNSQATPSKSSRKSSTDASPSHVSSTANNLVPKEGQEDNWWRKSRSSSQSTGTPAETPEPKGVDDRRPSANEAIPENLDTDERGYLSPDPPKEPSPSPEPPKDPTPSPEPPKEPTPSPEPPKEPTPSPEPPKEPTPSPEPPKEPTPSPEPPKEPTPSPEPVPREVRESTPSPEITLSPEPPKEPTPSPELDEQRKYSSDDAEYERDHYEEDDADEELRQLEERYPEPSEKKLNEGAGKDAFSNTEPGLEEDKDFRKKLRRTENSKIDTKAAFPSTKGKAEQVDFRNLLKKSDGPGKKDIKSGSKAQVDFRANLKSKDSDGRSPVRSPVQSPVHPPLAEEPPISTSPVVTKQPSVDNEDTKPAETNESSEESKPPPEDSYEARREARRRERELRRKQEEEAKPTSSTSDSTTATATTSAAEDSYEARREARRKAREERMKNIAESEPKMSYRERKEKEETKRRQEMSANKQKWAEMDQANGGSTERSFTRQKSSSGQQQLLAWCQHKTRYFENVDVKDFSNSWKDGLALCAILHNFVPDLIPYDDLTPDNPRKNYTIALKAAEDAGLERFFDVDDIIAAGSPDPKSMMTFLATIYTHFK